MDACRECSTPVAEGDRFCRQCGSLLADDIEVLSAEKAVTTAHLARQGPSPLAFVLAAGVLLMMGTFWALSRSSDDAPLNDGDETADPAAVVSDEDDDPEDDEESRSDTTTDGNVDTSEDDRGAAAEHAIALDEPGPILGEELGLSLWIGGSDNLSRIDLDTAEVQTFDVSNRRPILISGDWLVVGAIGGGGLYSVPIDNPDADQVRLGSGFYWDQFIDPSREEPGLIWLFGDSGGSTPTWQSVRLSDGEVVEELPASLGPFSGMTSGPDLASAPDGGIYERRSGEYVRVADGALAAISDARVLVRTCTAPTTCNVHWRDRTNWERIAGPDVPAGVLETIYPSWLSAGGRVLFSYSDRGELVYDLERGIELSFDSEDLWSLRPGSVSPDERLIAILDAATPEIHDLDTGEVYRLDRLSFVGEAGTLFAENG